MLNASIDFAQHNESSLTSLGRTVSVLDTSVVSNMRDIGLWTTQQLSAEPTARNFLSA